MASEPEPGRRFIVGIGVSEYDDPTLNLGAVPGDVSSMTEWFTTKCGVAHVPALEELAKSPTHEEITAGLRKWLQQLEPGDVVVIYVAGHGQVEDDIAYIQGRNSPREVLAGAALKGEILGDIIGQAKPHNVLLIIDACVAGSLATAIHTSAVTMATKRNTRDPYREWAQVVLCSTFQRDPAHDGRFVEAFLKVVAQESRTGSVRPWIDIDTVIEGLNEELRRGKVAQVVERTVWGPSPARLIPNPQYKTRPWGALFAEEELATHFGPSSRGVAAGEAGWYFTGRHKELARLVKWLAKSDTSGKPYVVTGSPGSGKSALVSRLIALSDRKRREQLPGFDALPPETVPPAGSINAVVWCHNKTADQVGADLAKRLDLGARTVAELLAALASETRPLAIVIDSLDEAVEGEASKIAAEIVRPLAKNKRIKVIVATRRHPARDGSANAEPTDLIEQLGVGTKDANALVLDAAKDRVIDIRAYAAARLMATAEPENESPYRDDPTLADRLAKRIAEAANTSFLVAAVTARSFAKQEQAVDPDTQAVDLPTEAGEALGQYIKRLPDPAVAVDILRPLAWAYGAGLPWGSLWAPIASALAGKKYDDEAVAKVLDWASDLIVETVADGEPVYRLFHEALAEYLRRDGLPWVVHPAFAEVIEATLDRSSLGSASSYALAHLVSHLLPSFRFDQIYDLITDPEWERAKRMRFGDSTRFLSDIDFAVAYMFMESTSPTARLVGACTVYGRMMAVAPAIIVGVLARAGQVHRAELMANNIEFAVDRCQAYTLIAPVFAADGDHAGAKRCLVEATRAISAIDSTHAAMAWSWVATVAVECGFRDVAAKACASAVAAVEALDAQAWGFHNAVFWAGLAARKAGDGRAREALRLLFAMDQSPPGRNQSLQAAAVLGLTEPLRTIWQRAIEDDGPDLVRPGNIALALADAGMKEELEQLFEVEAKRGGPRGEEDAQKRYAWALALNGDLEDAIAHIITIEDVEERVRALQRVGAIAVDQRRDDIIAAVKRLATKIPRTSEWRVQTLLADVFFTLGDRQEAIRVAEDVIRQEIVPTETNTVVFRKQTLLNAFSNLWKRLIRRGKSGRRSLQTSIGSLEDVAIATEVFRLVDAGQMDEAMQRLTEIRVPRRRWEVRKRIAEKTAASPTMSFWRDALREARFVGEPSVRETVAGMAARMRDDALRQSLLAEVRRINVRWIEAGFAENYESIRGSLRSGPERTRLLEGLMVLKTRKSLLKSVPTIDLKWWSATEVKELVDSGSEGKRAFALALMESNPALARFQVVLNMIQTSLSAFEQYHALRVMLSIVPKLGTRQRERLLGVLAAERQRHIQPGTDREKLARDVESAIEADRAAATSRDSESFGSASP
ncbi:MAG TPA: ATP-binding protein [Thermoanaerobaculia bacterium]|jgi:tetratricopeptide (TPR) repeat protein|nr:ATP-binding protein [Thermoanaerobaculia bacterium]